MRTILLPLALLLASVALCPATAQRKGMVDDWPMARHDARNTSLSSDEIAPPLRLLWRTKSYKYTKPFLLASGGVIAVTRQPSNAAEVPEISLYDRSGHVVWHLDHALPLYLEASRIVVAHEDKQGAAAECYDWRTGKLLWSQAVAGKQAVEYMLLGFWGASEMGGRLYWARREPDRSVQQIINLEDGHIEKEWATEAGIGYGPPALDGESLYWGVGHWMHVLDAKSLEPRWAFYDGGNSYPIPVGSLLWIQGWGHGAGAYDLKSRKALGGVSAWRGAAHVLIKRPGGGFSIVESLPDPAALAAFDVATGKELWRYPMLSANVYADGGLSAGSGRYVYVPGGHRQGKGGFKGGFYCVDALTGRPVWKYEKPGVLGSQIIVSEGRMYALDSEGMLYCFKSVAP